MARFFLAPTPAPDLTAISGNWLLNKGSTVQSCQLGYSNILDVKLTHALVLEKGDGKKQYFSQI